MMVVLTFHVGVLTYFNTLKCSHASLHPGKAGSCKQPLTSLAVFILTHSVNFPVGGNRSARRKPTTFGRVLTNSSHMSGPLGSNNIEKVLAENRTRSLRGKRRAL